MGWLCMPAELHQAKQSRLRSTQSWGRREETKKLYRALKRQWNIFRLLWWTLDHIVYIFLFEKGPLVANAEHSRRVDFKKGGRQILNIKMAIGVRYLWRSLYLQSMSRARQCNDLFYNKCVDRVFVNNHMKTKTHVRKTVFLQEICMCGIYCETLCHLQLTIHLWNWCCTLYWSIKAFKLWINLQDFIYILKVQQVWKGFAVRHSDFTRITLQLAAFKSWPKNPPHWWQTADPRGSPEPYMVLVPACHQMLETTKVLYLGIHHGITEKVGKDL